MTSVFSWQNSIILCPASFCTPRPTSIYLTLHILLALSSSPFAQCTSSTFMDLCTEHTTYAFSSGPLNLLFSRSKLEKAMAPHSSTLAWRIPWMEEPGRLQSMGSLRVGHDLAAAAALSWHVHGMCAWSCSRVRLFATL